MPRPVESAIIAPLLSPDPFAASVAEGEAEDDGCEVVGTEVDRGVVNEGEDVIELEINTTVGLAGIDEMEEIEGVVETVEAAGVLVPGDVVAPVEVTVGPTMELLPVGEAPNVPVSLADASEVSTGDDIEPVGISVAVSAGVSDGVAVWPGGGLVLPPNTHPGPRGILGP